MLTRLLQFLLLLLVVRLIGRAVARFVASRRPAPPAPSLQATDLVLDRVCGTYLPKERAVVAMIEGREQHFCSRECRAKAALHLSAAS